MAACARVARASARARMPAPAATATRGVLQRGLATSVKLDWQDALDVTNTLLTEEERMVMVRAAACAGPAGFGGGLAAFAGARGAPA